MADSNLSRLTLKEVLNIKVGAGGYKIADSETITGDTYVAVTSLTSSGGAMTVTVTTDADLYDTNALAIPAGETIYGRWTSVAVSSGDVAIVYKENSTSS